MKHKKRKYESNDMTVLQTLLDMYKSSNEELQAEVNRLRNEIAETNAMNIQADEKDKDYRNLTQLHTLLMVLMNMLTAHIDDSPLADAVGKAIKKYQLSIVKSLAKGTVYIKDEDLEDWEDEECNEDEGADLWDGEEEFE